MESSHLSSGLTGTARRGATFFGALGALVWKEALLERRGMERVIVTAGFSLLVVAMFHFTFDIRGEEAVRFFPGALWTAIFFAGTIGMARASWIDEVEGRSVGLLVAPIDRSLLYLSQFLFHFGLMILVELIAVPLFVGSFALGKIASVPMLLGALFLGTWGMVALGTLLSGATGGGRGSGLFLPLILFPLLVPVALGASALAHAAVTGEIGARAAAWLQVLVVFDVLFTAIPALLYEYLLEV